MIYLFSTLDLCHGNIRIFLISLIFPFSILLALVFATCEQNIPIVMHYQKKRLILCYDSQQQKMELDRGPKVYLSELTVRPKKVSICVRVVRKWPFDGNNPGGPILHVSLVLADEKVRYFCLIYSKLVMSSSHKFQVLFTFSYKLCRLLIAYNLFIYSVCNYIQGDYIFAQISQPAINKADSLDIGKVYIISKFTVRG